MRRACEERDKAAYWRDRASGAERNAGKHGVAYFQRRIDECEALLCGIERGLKGDPSAEYRARLQLHGDELRGRLDYWRGQLEEAGGLKFGRHNIKPGDLIAVRGRKARVLRANPKTVSVRIEGGGADGMRLKYLYAEITWREWMEQEVKP